MSENGLQARGIALRYLSEIVNLGMARLYMLRDTECSDNMHTPRRAQVSQFPDIWTRIHHEKNLVSSFWFVVSGFSFGQSV